MVNTHVAEIADTVRLPLIIGGIDAEVLFGDENASNTVSYERSKMQKDIILQMLKKKRVAG